ncbi:MAG TPA: MGMT family protein [Miltoncostaeaceae bacterium]|nr:MGMT family protein [Miltoncostaeaceae bacterium]
MPLFDVNPTTKEVTEVRPSTFPELKLWERQDLEAWVTSAPELAGGDFTVITSEYDKFDRTSERLDILGITRLEPGIGRLVVVELKRDGGSTTVDLQAIKYAAYVAAAQFEDVVQMHADHHDLPPDESRARLSELLGATEDAAPIIDNTPRIVLVAGDFRPEVTTTVLWLIDNYEMDIRCVRLQPFLVGSRVVVHSETVIPLPEAEQYRLGVLRKRRDTEREQQARERAARLLPRLRDAEALEEGRWLYFRRDLVPSDRPPWSEDEPLYRAKLVSADGNKNLEWIDPRTGEPVLGSPSGLAAILLHLLGHRESDSASGVNGMLHWTTDGTTTLRQLAQDAGIEEGVGSPRPIDHDLLRRYCAAIPPGWWTTYGDLAAAVGSPGAAMSIGTLVANDPQITTAHRILRAGGVISPGWESAEGGPDVARQRLVDEGLTFTAAGRAAPERRWTPALPDDAGS